MKTKVASENKTIEICCHRISYYYDNCDDKMPESDQEHVKDCIVDGCNQGELCFIGKEGTEYRGWWHIKA